MSSFVSFLVTSLIAACGLLLAVIASQLFRIKTQLSALKDRTLVDAEIINRLEKIEERLVRIQLQGDR